MTNRKAVLAIILSLIAVQLIDIAIHVVTGQAEPIRLLSNGILGLWALGCLAGKTTAKTGLIAIALYLGLNGVFLAMNGITNPQQGGAVRLPLFVLVGVSTLLALWLRAKANRD